MLGLIFLKYISDAFEELHHKLQQGEGEYAEADPEDGDEYKRKMSLLSLLKLAGLICKQEPNYPKSVKMSMDAIEKENPSLKGVLPKVSSQPLNTVTSE